jgi:putative flippase GtrA
VGAVIKYWLNYSMAFRSSAPHAHAVLRYILMLAVFLGMNTALFATLHRALGLHYLVAQVLTTILLIAPGYLVSRRWVFRR